jgi:hypothetical protein
MHCVVQVPRGGGLKSPKVTVPTLLPEQARRPVMSPKPGLPTPSAGVK